MYTRYFRFSPATVLRKSSKGMICPPSCKQGSGVGVAVFCGVGDGSGVIVGSGVEVETGVAVFSGVTMMICGVGVITGANGSHAQNSSRIASGMRSRFVIERNYSPTQ